ncbi:hypothetical protein [Actinoplanes sp. NPDC049265]|uniref:hypothetical protein n=1 Tax=Actinoplanes sp. NPDC049265 TaxID=3363902 RepID=UPI00371B472F
MLDAGGGGGYGGTDWSGMSMTDMWKALQNQDTTPHWELVDGWRKSYELTLQHISAVRSYRDNLASAWPPDKSRASAAYIDRLDALLEHLQETYDAAIANHSAFSSATLSISSSRRELETVVTEYLANETKLADYEQAKEAANVPLGEDNLPRPTPTNPVAAGRQIQLETRARAIMSSLSTDLIQARSQLKQPARYTPTAKGGIDEDDSDVVGPPPPIPPVATFDPGSSSASGSGHSAVGSARTLPTDAGVTTPSGGGGRLPGLVLGGVQPPVAAPLAPPPVVSPPSPGPTYGTPISPPIAGPSGYNGLRGGASGLTGPSGKLPSGGRGIPPSGVIRNPSTVTPGQSTPGRPAVNPVGGVIAPNTPGKTSGSPGRPGMAPMAPMGSRPNEPDDHSPDKQRWDPDNPWRTAKGVDPVLMPTEEPPIDPGPAIGLS